MGERTVRRGLCAVVVGLLLGGCSGAGDDSAGLCDQVDALTTEVDALEKADVGAMSADDLKAQAHDVEARLDAVEAEADGAWDTLITALRDTVDDVVTKAIAADKEDRDIATAVLEDSVEDVGQAWNALQKVAEVRCGKA